MIKVGITGGMGSGKTTVCTVFSHLGFPVYNSDNEAKKLMDSDVELIHQIKSEFGSDIYFPNGFLDRKRLASLIFSNKNALQTINSLVHPAVKRHFTQWADTQSKKHNILIKEAAILIESGTHKDMDVVLLVYTPLHERIERLVRRSGESGETILARINNQMSEDEKIEIANFVINNSHNQLILPQIQKLILKHFDTKCLMKELWKSEANL